MGKINVEISDNLLNELPLGQENLEKIIKLGLQQFNTIQKTREKSIVDETFGAIPIGNHKLIEETLEHAKYGE